MDKLYEHEQLLFEGKHSLLNVIYRVNAEERLNLYKRIRNRMNQINKYERKKTQNRQKHKNAQAIKALEK